MPKKKQVRRHKSRKAPKQTPAAKATPDYWKCPPPDESLAKLWRWARIELEAAQPRFSFDEAIAALEPRITEKMKTGTWKVTMQAVRAMRGIRDFDLRRYQTDAEMLGNFLDAYVTEQMVKAQAVAEAPVGGDGPTMTTADLNKQMHDTLKAIGEMSLAERKRLLAIGAE